MIIDDTLILFPICLTWYLNVPKLLGIPTAKDSGIEVIVYPSGRLIETLFFSIQAVPKSTGYFRFAVLKGFVSVVKNNNGEK